MATLSSSHIHLPEVEKLKKWPSMAKLLTKATRRPVGCPASFQLPVSSTTVRRRPISTTSPPTPRISTQSPTRMPLRPMRMNQPKKATMKSFMATVRPAPARPSTVVVWAGRPKVTKTMASPQAAWSASFTATLKVPAPLLAPEARWNR